MSTIPLETQNEQLTSSIVNGAVFNDSVNENPTESNVDTFKKYPPAFLAYCQEIAELGIFYFL